MCPVPSRTSSNCKGYSGEQYAELLDSDRLVGNLHRAYAELDGHEPGAPVDVGAAPRDMAAHNGGYGLTCLA